MNLHPAVAWQKNCSGFKRRILFSRAEDRKKFALMKTILNAEKKQQQAGKSTPFEAMQVALLPWSTAKPSALSSLAARRAVCYSCA